MTKSMNNLKPASPKMGGGGCSVRNNKMTGGSNCSSRNNKMIGGDKSKKNNMKGGSSKKSKKSKKPMKANEAYCMMCKSRVVVHDPKDITKKTKTRTMVMREALCPKGHKTYRIVGN